MTVEYDPSFVVYINHEGDFGDIVQPIRENVSGIEWLSVNVGTNSHNHIDVSKNQLYDPKRVNEIGGYIYYKFMIMVSPRKNPVSEDEMRAQAQFAKELLNALSANNFAAVLDDTEVNEFIK